MSLKKSFRSRFLSDKHKVTNEDLLLNVDRDTLNSILHDDTYEVIETENRNSPNPTITGANRMTGDDGCGSGTVIHSEETPRDSGFKDETEKMVYELQLTQLQDQLLSSAVENESLRSELLDIKDNIVETLRRDLSNERAKVSSLQKEINSINGAESTRSSLKRKAKVSTVAPAPVEDVISTDEDVPVAVEIAPDPPQTRYQRFWVWLMSFWCELLEDLSETGGVIQEEADGDPLTVKRLKESIKRFGAAMKPYINLVKGLYSLMSWKSPVYTLFVFSIYMCCLWRGCLLSLVLALLTFRLFLNYLQLRGWSINVNFLDAGQDEKETEEDLGMSDKLNLVLSVARKVQNTLMMIADGLEKVQSLLLWRHSSTRQLFTVLLLAYISSLFFSPTFLIYVAGYYLGIKFFIIDNIFNTYPRLKRKYDTVHRIWQALPTNAQYEMQSRSELGHKLLGGEYIYISEGNKELEADSKNFSELFSLPAKEVPLTGWTCGKRCTLIDKNKPITSGGIKNGLLFLTRNYLCFLRSKTPHSKNIAVPLTDISYVDRAKAYTWLPGRGFAIEIGLLHTEKIHVFGAMANRDEVLEAILAAGKALQLSWAYTD